MKNIKNEILLKEYKELVVVLLVLKKVAYKDYYNFFAESVKIEKFKIFLKNFDIKLFHIFLELNIKVNEEILFKIYNLVERGIEFEEVKKLFIEDRETILTKELAKLALDLLDTKEVYIPFTKGIVYETNKKLYIENESLEDNFFAEALNILENKDIIFHLSNPLLNPTFIDEKNTFRLKKFEGVFSASIFKIDRKSLPTTDKFDRFLMYPDVIYFEHILAQMKEKAVIILPLRFSYSPQIQCFRRYLVEQNLLEAVLELPRNVFNNTSIEGSIWVLNKQSSNTIFINLKEFVKKEKRKLKLVNIEKIVSIYNNKVENDYAKLVSKTELKKENYSFLVDRYLLNEELKKIHLELSQFKTIRLEKFAEFIRGQLLREGDKKVFEITPLDFAEVGFTTKGQEKFIDRIGKYKIQSFDILVTTRGNTGKVAIVGEISDDFIPSQTIQIIRLKNKEEAIFLYMYLRSNIGQTILKNLTIGNNMPQISINDLKNIEIPMVDKTKIINNFYKEIKIYEEIKKLQNQIKDIDNNFLD